MSDNIEIRLGWLRDVPDWRDYTPEHPHVAPTLMALRSAPRGLPSSVNLRAWCSPVEDQGDLGSCTANAGVGLFEYFERKTTGTDVDASRLFLYKATRDLLGWKGDSGAYLRTTMAAMALFGAPPEKYWPYDVARFDEEPSSFLYAFAASYRAITYYRLDPPGSDRSALLSTIKTLLASGLPSMFGFTVYQSMMQAKTTGQIPFPTAGESVLGGHAVVAVGYDDTIQIKNAKPGAIATKGALLIRNSWGPDWGGNGGYLWMPYDFVLKGIAVDWWSLIKADWTNPAIFSITDKTTM
jgi:C1A family cysteine protease